ncbi:composite domain of metallo-dependent hydrolase [Hymenopellis radicata]|nr:composite domain of metallo-dependent hydrolase [Hymenopellis radicata]
MEKLLPSPVPHGRRNRSIQKLTVVDNVWPYREQTAAWDISTDFAYPRTLEYDVEEGTWLRLDVHPVSGEIVFDMLGDLYCLVSGTAHPILVGVPYDSDPHFSPDGDRLVFRSDAELGVENIWVMPWTGCAAMDVRRPELAGVLKDRREDNALLVKGLKENAQRRWNRLVGEGRLEARRVTNETFRWVSDARFHPSGTKIIASKWYTSTITYAASEGWEYDVPSLSTNPQIRPQSGRRLLGRTLPAGMTLADYGDMQIGPEQFVWRSEDTLIYSKNVKDLYRIGDKDIHQGVYAIFSRNVTSGKDTVLVDAFPGGASRPELSRDKRTLAFVRRVRDHQVLVFKDLETGTIHYIFDGLSFDLSFGWAPMGTYPSYAFTPSDDAVIIWAAGQIYRVPLAVNGFGERVAGGAATPIPFRAHIELKLAETLTGGIDLVGLETQDEMNVTAFRDLGIDATGAAAVFQAAGVTVVQDLSTGVAAKVPVVNPRAPYYSPAFVGGSSTLVVHARWSDTNFTTFEIADVDSGIAYEVGGLALGRYHSPSISTGPGVERKIAFIKTAGDSLTGNVVATARPGLYVGDIVLPSDRGADVFVHNVRFISELIPGVIDRVHLKFLQGDELLVHEASRVYTIDISAESLVLGEYPQHTLVSGKMTNEISVGSASDMLAFVEFHHVLSLYGGHDLAWSGDGNKLFWFFGPTLHWLEVDHIKQCASEIKADGSNFGIACVKDLVQAQGIHVSHSTDIARIKQEVALSGRSGVLAIRNATILTMQSGVVESDLIVEGTMLVENGVITAVGSEISIPSGAHVIDARGGFVTPGYIDVHAHWGGGLVIYPAKSWEMQTFLAYGVTTLHNPSSETVTTFIERSRLESGQLVGPRSFTTGSPLFGGGWVGIHQEIVDMDEAAAALMRIKAEGGPAALSYKNYQLPSRASRQRLLKKGRELGLLCVPEGGGYYDWDLTYIIDGMTTVEHSIPVSVLYDDVLTLYARSGTGATPTHVVSYGGAFGEEYEWAHYDVPNDPKLRRFIRHDILEGLHESKARPKDSYGLFNISESIAKMVHMGLKTHIGAHGERPMGHNYHAEMAFTKAGGLTNYEVLQAATSSAAQTLGMWGSVGSLAPGKLADFLVYEPDVDLLEGPIGGTREMVVWDAASMAEVWPLEGRLRRCRRSNP